MFGFFRIKKKLDSSIQFIEQNLQLTNAKLLAEPEKENKKKILSRDNVMSFGVV